MESSNLYKLQQQQLATNSSLAAQSTHQWHPSLPLIKNDDFEHYMNEILPISAQTLTKNDMNFGCDYVNLNQNLWLTTSPAAAAISSSSCNVNYVMDSVITASSNSTTTDLATDFPSFFNHQDSNKKSARKNKAIKRVSSSSQNDAAAAKKQRATSDFSCPFPKVVKEKMGDRIAALHRLVAPFGKTDAASVLTEAIGYIQFLHHQIETMSTPCTRPPQSNPLRCFQGVLSEQEGKECLEGDLTSRGLSLVPISVASYISASTV